MDTTAAIIGLVSLALFIVPIMLIQRKQKTSLLKDFMNLATQQQLVLTQHDTWNHSFAIGIDTAQNSLYYLKKREDKEHTALIRLSEVAACRVINRNRDVNGNKVIDLIELRFTFRNPKLPEQALEFYNQEESMTLNEELILAEKWKAIATSNLQAPQAHKGGSLAVA